MNKEKPNLKVLAELSQIHIKQQNYFSAYLLLQKVFKEDSSHALALQNYAILNEQIENKKKEKKWNSKKSAESLVKAESLIEKQQLADAKNILFEILNLEPMHVEALIDLAVAEYLEGYIEKSLQLTRNVLELEPSNEIAITNLKEIEKELGNTNGEKRSTPKSDQDDTIIKTITKFRESAIAHKYLDGLQGLEIGGSAHNQFGLNTKNVDYVGTMDTCFKEAEIEMCGEALPVDIVANGDDLISTFDESVDFVISSHVIEHFFDPLKALFEWKRVIKKGGYVFTIAPLKEFTPGENRNISSFDELLERHKGILKPNNIEMIKGHKFLLDNDNLTKVYIDMVSNNGHGHFTVFDLDLLCKCIDYVGLEIVEKLPIDDKVGNGFCVLARKF